MDIFSAQFISGYSFDEYDKVCACVEYSQCLPTCSRKFLGAFFDKSSPHKLVCDHLR